MTHVFATYAFLSSASSSGDLPLGAAVSLFMFPILGDRRRVHPARRAQAREGDRMTTTELAATSARRSFSPASLRRNRRWALITSYVFLIVFAIFFLLPPYYMIVTSLKSDARDGAHCDQPVDHRQRHHARPVTRSCCTKPTS